MTLRQIISTFVSMALAISFLGVPVSAEIRPPLDTAQPMYEIAKSPKSSLLLSGTEATCISNINGINTIQISVVQTLEQNQGSLSWEAVTNANWINTVQSGCAFVQNKKSGLSSGTYRLKTVFTLTDTNGKTETVTVYSDEKTVT